MLRTKEGTILTESKSIQLDDGRIATWHSVGNVIYLSFHIDPLELLWR